MAPPLDRSIYLASRSPRRRELLAHIGVRFHLLLFRALPASDPEVSEAPRAGETPRQYVMRVARAKAAAGWQRLLQRRLPQAPVLAADTAVALGEHIFCKPLDRREAAAMLAALAGRRHEVLTAVALSYGSRLESALSVSDVEFRQLAASEIEDYVASGECDDKAGAYAIQGRAARFVVEIRGSHSGIVGLPLFETAQLLERMDASPDRREATGTLRPH
ncbi:MAG: septum formation protein Maf [Betaproteobacteria bacterium RIFCSPLOWO2_02_67_12]|nr:MAG: septum formation protein Maf [Betaproteobacteria bacterium RIFCSPLOWO2_02_67_12]OGA27815.1 MAG: septum formation protein Maf [Betaproteobacteria bacterium RIFCSPLOWO2_02_FULL_68_150]OGA73198.1 MAG: septum formation protein Maf [Betaproteobacteria bacterium RIFCSPLOWO2_12_FULL_67_28]